MPQKELICQKESSTLPSPIQGPFSSLSEKLIRNCICAWPPADRPQKAVTLSPQSISSDDAGTG